jgi:hypothetical protein
MGDSRPASASARSGGVLPVQKPRWAFWNGLLTGAAIAEAAEAALARPRIDA